MKSSMISAANIDKIKKTATKIEKKVTFDHFFRIFWALAGPKTGSFVTLFSIAATAAVVAHPHEPACETET